MSKISVCMATCNGQVFIREQIESILRQLSATDELIISDDSSTDDTIKIIESFNDSRVTLYKNNKFYSPVLNFENALKRANGDIIFLSDQDDVWLDVKIEKTIPYFDKFDLVVSDCKVVDGELNCLKESFFRNRNRRKAFFQNLYSNPYLGCCMAFRKKVLDYALPFPKHTPMHDIWLGLSTELINGKIAFVDDCLILYRRHGSNNSCTGEKSNRPLFQRIWYRLNLIWHLISRHVYFKSMKWLSCADSKK